jgi:hypothetical protein
LPLCVDPPATGRALGRRLQPSAWRSRARLALVNDVEKRRIHFHLTGSLQ